uniref:Uncharacterized protein n=1 Tax=Rhizophora mucronata TaxID=61149 RepID=A0A2P2P5I4_RHIMU
MISTRTGLIFSIGCLEFLASSIS